MWMEIFEIWIIAIVFKCFTRLPFNYYEDRSRFQVTNDTFSEFAKSDHTPSMCLNLLD